MTTIASSAAADAAVQGGKPFDIEAAIAELLEDPQRHSLELPHMTTGQRKHARRVVEEHAELRCESYGFGADRRLHVFKQTCDSDGSNYCSSNLEVVAPSGGFGGVCHNGQDGIALPSAVSANNAFIDDCLTTEGNIVQAEPITIRSMPMNLSKGLLPVSPERSSSTAWDQESSPICSTTASRIASSPSLVDDSPASSFREPMIEVRNTFIHIDGGSADERIVQSMPHSMFRQCLFEEQQAAAGCEPVTSTPETLPCSTHGIVVAGRHLLAPGTEVMVQGLVKAPAFNGRCGVVQSWDQETERYNILLSMPSTASGHQQAKIKPENMLLTIPSGSFSRA